MENTLGRIDPNSYLMPLWVCNLQNTNVHILSNLCISLYDNQGNCNEKKKNIQNQPKSP